MSGGGHQRTTGQRCRFAEFMPLLCQAGQVCGSIRKTRLQAKRLRIARTGIVPQFKFQKHVAQIVERCCKAAVMPNGLLEASPGLEKLSDRLVGITETVQNVDMRRVFASGALKEDDAACRVICRKAYEPKQHERIGLVAVVGKYDLTNARARVKRAPLKVFSGALEQFCNRLHVSHPKQTDPVRASA